MLVSDNALSNLGFVDIVLLQSRAISISRSRYTEQKGNTMKVSEKVMTVVFAAEKDKRDLDRCLNMLLCPQCAGKLDVETDKNGIFSDYTCTECSFRHTS